MKTTNSEEGYIIITNDFLEGNKTLNGSWTYAQLESLGIECPPRRGWKHSLIGTKITESKVKEFIQHRNTRRSKSKKKNEVVCKIKELPYCPTCLRVYQNSL